MIRSVDMTAGFDWPDDTHVYGRIFTFGVPTRVSDPLPDGTLDIYDEEFVPGCTTRMRQAAPTPRWVRFTFDHEQDFSHRAGFVQTLTEGDDGVYAGIELYEGRDVDKFRSMLRTSHTGLSVEFLDTTRTPPSGPLRHRRQIHISAVTATPIPAYAGAQVLAVRADDPLAPIATPRLDAVRALLADLAPTCATAAEA